VNEGQSGDGADSGYRAEQDMRELASAASARAEAAAASAVVGEAAVADVLRVDAALAGAAELVEAQVVGAALAGAAELVEAQVVGAAFVGAAFVGATLVESLVGAARAEVAGWLSQRSIGPPPLVASPYRSLTHSLKPFKYLIDCH